MYGLNDANIGNDIVLVSFLEEEEDEEEELRSPKEAGVNRVYICKTSLVTP